MVTSHRKLGDQGEDLAVQFLRKKGYVILERNFLVREGEIDIVAEANHTMVFLEVKTRRSKTFGTGEEAITPKKEARLMDAIQRYFQKKQIDPDGAWRIDVITVDLTVSPPQIEHLEDAFA